MTRIIKYLIIYITGLILFDNLTKDNHRFIIKTLTAQLKTLPLRDVINFPKDLFSNKLTDNSILSKISIPLGLNWRLLCDTNAKKIYLLVLTSSILIYRWFTIMKKVLLWPFKLGLFSFLFSIFGFDMTWYLSLFNIFTINIPQWIYFQYLLLYGNWLNWWHNIVNIKSLNVISLPLKNKEVIKPTELEFEESSKENKSIIENKKRFFIFLGISTHL